MAIVVPELPVIVLSMAIVISPLDGFGYNHANSPSGRTGQALNALPGEPPSHP